MKDEKNRRVVITGYGAYTPLGKSAAEHWEAIMAYRLGYRYVAMENQEVKARFFGIIDDEPDLKSIPAMIRRRLPRHARYAMASAREAMAMAFGDSQPTDFHDPFYCGAIIGSGWGGMDEIYQYQTQFKEIGVGSPFGCFHSMHNVSTAACSMMWGLRGYQNTPIAACATGTIAIGDAFDAIRSGRATMMLAGAGESLRSDAAIWNIDVLGALSREQNDPLKASCPFSLDRNGFVLSEGAAVVCLESLDSAQARGATILGEVRGYSSYSDAFDFTAPATDMQARIRTINGALHQAGITASELDYINAHGTSTALNDLNETDVYKTILGNDAGSIPISSTKGLSGHLISAAGSFETIICLQAMHYNIVPATSHLHTPDPACDLDYVANQHRAASLNTVMNVNFGFGGTNAALILGRYH